MSTPSRAGGKGATKGSAASALDLYALVEPRSDVLEGALTDAVFAASLDEVVAGTAPNVYGRPEEFFANTYPSAGLRTLLEEALGRVGGGKPDSPPVIRLETSLGGGKTHNLIGLYHAARGGLDPIRALEFMDPALLPSSPLKQLAVFVGTSAGATTFPTIHGISAKTPWGYIALQLAGKDAYELLGRDDASLTAPGADALRKIMGGRPSLILIDEIARYLAVAEGQPVGYSNLGEQTAAFLMALMEAVAAHPNACLVITTATANEVFGEQTLKVMEITSKVQALMARKEHVLRASEEVDLPKILARRLFARVDDVTAAQVGKLYAEALSEAFARGADLPERVTRPTWADEVARSWPFHPDLINVLDKRLSTVPNFQRTRGALRLLARTVRLLWKRRLAGTHAIHLHHIDLSDRDTVEDLTSRIDRATLEPVVRVDIASQAGGEPAHAEQVDAAMGTGTPYARRLAVAAYLYSLTREAPGVPGPVLIAATFTPGDDYNVLAKALDGLESSAWYLNTDARGYRFSTEASLVKLVHEAERQVSPGRAKQAATDILAGVFKDSALKVKRTWEDAKVPDRDDDAWLVLLHWDEFGEAHGVGSATEAVPRQVREIWEKTAAGGVREYRNRLVLLLPSSLNHEPMLRTVRRHLALHDLLGSPDTVRSLPDEKKKELAGLGKESELLARIAICNHLNILYVPQAQGLEAVELDIVTQASARQNQTDAILDRLAAMEKTLTAGDRPLDPAYIRSKLGEQLGRPMPTIDLVRAFARRTDLKMVLDRAQISALVISGVRNGVWEYQDAERGERGWATKDTPSFSARLAEDTLICPLGSAPPPSPIGLVLPPLPSKTPSGSVFEAGGNAGVAVRQAREKAADAGQLNLVGLTITIDEVGAGTAASLAKLLSVVPPGTAGVSLIYEVNAQVDLGSPDHRLAISFVGPAAEYQPLKPALDHVLRQHQAALKVSIIATFNPQLALAGEAVEGIRRRAADTGPEKCLVKMTTSRGD